MFTDWAEALANMLATPAKFAPLTRLLHTLATPLVPDDYVELLNPLLTRSRLRAKVISVVAEAGGAATVTLQPGPSFKGHMAGQYLRLTVSVNGVRHSRCYSISSAPERADGLISLTVKAIADGVVSQHINTALVAGTVVDIAAAEGEFVWPAAPQKLLLIAAGSGITPLMSQLRSAALRGAMPNSTLIYYSPSAEQTVFGAELQTLAAAHPALTVQFVHTRSGKGGHFSSAQLRELCPDWAERLCFACGPNTLLESLEAQWAVQGRSAQLITERFRPRLAPVPEGTVGGALHFAKSGLQADSSGMVSILESAEAAGLAPAHGCRMGICHGCTVALKCGQVRDLRDGRIHRDEGDLIQICVCAPVGAVSLDL